MSHGTPFCPISFSHWSGSKPQVFGMPSSLDCHQNSAAALSRGDPTVTVPQDQFLHELQQDRDGVDVRMGRPKAQDVDLGGS